MKCRDLVPALLFLVVVSCQPVEQPVEAPTTFSSLEGTWQLVLQMDDDSAWKDPNPTIIYEKYLTPTHFIWINYDTENDSLLGTGGGTYVFDSVTQTYTEDIKFFLPAGSNELGQAIPFSVGYEDGQWHHKGYAMEYEFDPETGDNMLVDSALINEKWVRTSAPSSDSSLIGTWQLLSQKQFGDSLFIEYPEFIKYQKLITPTHFAWVNYNADGDEVTAAGGGTYVATEDGYQEKVVYIYPSGSFVQGQTIDFTKTMDDQGIWHMEGYLEDSTKIDEFWERYKPAM